jgi:cytoskeleton protein RodZ
MSDIATGASQVAADPAHPTTAGGARELRVVANADTWLSIAIDEGRRESVLLHAGEARVWTAADTFTVTIGNAGGVTLSIDGRELPALGRPGQVVRNLRLPEAAERLGSG